MIIHHVQRTVKQQKGKEKTKMHTSGQLMTRQEQDPHLLPQSNPAKQERPQLPINTEEQIIDGIKLRS